MSMAGLSEVSDRHLMRANNDSCVLERIDNSIMSDSMDFAGSGSTRELESPNKLFLNRSQSHDIPNVNHDSMIEEKIN